MSKLETTYLGLKLKNPVIVGSSGLTSSIEKIKQIEEKGAGAIVLKSIFEEQIKYEAGKMANGSDSPEALDYVNYYVKNNTVEQYLDLIRNAKEAVNIPVIASGGVSQLSDVKDLNFIPNLWGVITGKALYSGALDLKEAIELVKNAG